MRKEYHETQAIEEILKYGFWIEAHWESKKTTTNFRDKSTYMEYTYRAGASKIRLLVKYFSGLGWKPKAIKQKISELWINYNPYVDFKFLNKTIASVRRKKDYDLVDIDSVKVSKEAMDWFAQMKDTDSKDWCNPIPNARVSISERSEGKLGFSACKLMFVYYIWVQIQSQYKKGNPCWINMDNTKRRLIQEAHLPSWKKIFEQRCILYDWGLIFDPMWMSCQGDPFYMSFVDLIPQGEETIEVDFENPRKWFEGYFKETDMKEKKALTNKCPKCGKYFKRNPHNHMPDCLCPECAKQRDLERRKEKYQKKKMDNA